MRAVMEYDEILLLKQSLESSLSLVERVIKQAQVRDREPFLKDKMEYIVRTVFSYAGLPTTAMDEKMRTGDVLKMKKICCYILTDYGKFSLYAVKNKLGYRQHGTVLSHRNKMRMWMNEPRYAPKDIYLTTKNILTKLGYE